MLTHDRLIRKAINHIYLLIRRWLFGALTPTSHTVKQASLTKERMNIVFWNQKWNDLFNIVSHLYVYFHTLYYIKYVVVTLKPCVSMITFWYVGSPQRWNTFYFTLEFLPFIEIQQIKHSPLRCMLNTWIFSFFSPLVQERLDTKCKYVFRKH